MQINTNFNDISAPGINNNAKTSAGDASFSAEINKTVAENPRKKKNYPINKRSAADKNSSANGRIILSAITAFLGLVLFARACGAISFDILESFSLFWPLIFIFLGIFITLKDGWWPVTISLIALAAISSIIIAASRKKPANSTTAEKEAGSLYELPISGYNREN